MCHCKNIEAGTYENQIICYPPFTVRNSVGRICRVGIDQCVLEEVIDLWLKGIETVECCCGHNSGHKGYIAVGQNFFNKMKTLGYRNQIVYGELRKDIFDLKQN